MSGVYMLSGVFTGIAFTSINMGGDGRIGMLFIPSIILALIGAAIEYNQKGR